MSTYVVYQKVHLLKRFPEQLPDSPNPPPDFQGVRDTFAISFCYRKIFRDKEKMIRHIWLIKCT